MITIKKKIIVLCLFFKYNFLFTQSFEIQNLHFLAETICFDVNVKEQLIKIINVNKKNNSYVNIEVPSNNIPCLFKYYPGLKTKIAHVNFSNTPTPITNCSNLSKELNFNLFVKRDDQICSNLNLRNSVSNCATNSVTTSAINSEINNCRAKFGGNKIRKLEFLLADARARNFKSIITFGCAGSNHALATCLYAKEFGLNACAILLPQHNSHVLRRNLLVHAYNNSKIILTPSLKMRALVTQYYCCQQIQKFGSAPYFIPVGGSCPVGILGFINAAFELKEQIDEKITPEPDYIYLPVGSGGTYAGLLIGIKAAGLKSKLIGVTIEPEVQEKQFLNKILTLSNNTIDLLKDNDNNFKLEYIKPEDINLLYDYCGEEYSLFTSEAVEAKARLKNLENIELDGVYTAKAFAGLLADAKTRVKQNQIVLFWNTFCSNTLEELLPKEKLNQNTYNLYKKLPKAFHEYFEQDVQELDK